ncbi:MAG: GH25 family lysozyme [Amaricoccus sp.]
MILTKSFLAGLFLLVSLNQEAVSADLDDEFSRQEIYSWIRFNEDNDFALPQNFTFPGDARKESTFGVDFSHHNIDSCHCKIDWDSISQQGVKFVYIKATQGASYVDPQYEPNEEAIAAAGIDRGAYHFLTAADAPDDQWQNFLGATKIALPLPPALDLEWDAGPMQANCKNDAIIEIRKANGDVTRRCDKWSFVKSSDIVAMANAWLDAAKAFTGQEPVLYTSAAWWAARIAKSFEDSGIHAKIVWTADYTKNGRLTEKPRSPGGSEWLLWQFTDGAKVPHGKEVARLDASIFQGSRDEFRSAIGYK